MATYKLSKPLLESLRALNSNDFLRAQISQQHYDTLLKLGYIYVPGGISDKGIAELKRALEAGE